MRVLAMRVRAESLRSGQHDHEQDCQQGRRNQTRPQAGQQIGLTESRRAGPGLRRHARQCPDSMCGHLLPFCLPLQPISAVRRVTPSSRARDHNSRPASKTTGACGSPLLRGRQRPTASRQRPTAGCLAWQYTVRSEFANPVYRFARMVRCIHSRTFDKAEEVA